MRIAVYCPHYEDAGGVREVVRRLNAGMAARGHALSVIAREPSGNPTLPEVDDAGGAQLWRVRLVRAPHPALGARAYRRFLRRFPASAARLVRGMRRIRPDLIAAHTTKFHAPYVLALRVAVGAPIVVHLHNGPETADGPESPRLQRLLQRCARRVIGVSPAVAEYARACLPARADAVTVVPNGSDPAEFVDAAPEVRPRPYVLGVGALAPRKGFDVLIDALATSGTDLDLVLAGDGPERADLAARAAARGLGDRLALLGEVSRARVAGLMRGAAVVVIPSRFEGFSLVCREAMLAGAAVVASALPVLPPELVSGATGLLVPIGDAAALGRAVADLVADPLRARALGRAAREAARRFPGWDEVTERTLAEYERALATV